MKFFRIIFLQLILTFVAINSNAQGVLDWWDNLHDFPNAAGPVRDRYINISPGYMGPNAFAMPFLPNMLIDNEFWVQVSGQSHSGNGDKTQNFFLKGNFPIAKDKIHLYITSIPFETWEVTPETRDERRMMGLPGVGSNTGDIAYGFVFKIFREGYIFPFNFGARVHAKTTTGGNLSNARFTDHGLFQWEGNFSKHIINRENEKFLLKMSLGFVTWQTNKNRLPGGSNHLQNDAPSYSFGVEYQKNKWWFGSDIAGYTGYIGNRDYPHFSRTQIQYRQGKIAFRAEFNYGLQSWDWNTTTVGFRYFLGEILE